VGKQAIQSENIWWAKLQATTFDAMHDRAIMADQYSIYIHGNGNWVLRA